MDSKFEKVDKHNDQLHVPSKYSKERELILNLYKDKGYNEIDKYYYENYKKERLFCFISNILPKNLKRNVKRIKGAITPK